MRNTILVDVEELKAKLWDKLVEADNDTSLEDEDVLAELTVQKRIVMTIEAMGCEVE